MKFFYSQSVDPFENLALENHFLRFANKTKDICLFWQSRPAVIMGRFQNPWLECDLKTVLNDGVQLVRRISGGGCVYHDLGNLNFCVISEEFRDPWENLLLIMNALKKWKIAIQMNDRYDLLLNDKKVSGSAFKRIKKGYLHHATLLFNTEADLIAKYLHHHQPSLESRSIASKRSAVSGLGSACSELSIKAFLEEFKPEMIHPADFDLVDFITHLRSDDWLWRETPRFSFHMPWQNHSELKLNVQKCKIDKITFAHKSELTVYPYDLVENQVFDLSEANEDLSQWVNSISLVC